MSSGWSIPNVSFFMFLPEVPGRICIAPAGVTWLCINQSLGSVWWNVLLALCHLAVFEIDSHGFSVRGVVSQENLGAVIRKEGMDLSSWKQWSPAFLILQMKIRKLRPREGWELAHDYMACVSSTFKWLLQVRINEKLPPAFVPGGHLLWQSWSFQGQGNL